jgi:hypothetical protein
MGRSPKTVEALRAQELVSSSIRDLNSKLKGHGLPEDVLIRALEGYDATELSWPGLRAKGLEFGEYISAQVSDCTVRKISRRPIGRKPPAVSFNILRLMATPLRAAETLFGAYIYTFTFWPSGVWLITAFDPLFTTDHLHQRLVQRAAGDPRSLAKTHDSLSILWPALLEVDQRRRLRGLPTGRPHFVTPLNDGLVLGCELQRNDFAGVVEVAQASPKVMDLRNGAVFERPLVDRYCNGRERVMVVARTYVGEKDLKDGQRRLKRVLERFVHRHRPVVEYLQLRPRLAFDDVPYGRDHFKLYVHHKLSRDEILNALSDLEEITLTTDWVNEIDRNLENQKKRRHA